MRLEGDGRPLEEPGCELQTRPATASEFPLDVAMIRCRGRGQSKLKTGFTQDSSRRVCHRRALRTQGAREEMSCSNGWRHLGGEGSEEAKINPQGLVGVETSRLQCRTGRWPGSGLLEAGPWERPYRQGHEVPGSSGCGCRRRRGKPGAGGETEAGEPAR